MLRHTSIHTYNIPEETNLLPGYALCVWGEHGRTRPLNTPGGAQRECRQPLFSTLRHVAHKHSCPSHGPFVPCHFIEVPVMDTVSFLWTFITHIYINTQVQCMASFSGECIRAQPVHKRTQAPQNSCLTTDAGKHAYACRHRIIAKALYRNSDNYPKTITPKR